MAYPIPKSLYTQIEYYLTNYPDMSATEIARKIDKPGRSVRRYVRAIQQNDYVLRSGPEVSSLQDESFEDDAEQFDPVEFMRFMKKLQKRKATPDYQYSRFTFEEDEPVVIMFVSCMHLGGLYTAYDEFMDLYQQFLSMPNVYWWDLGDTIEGYISKFGDQEAIDNQIISVENQILLLREILRSIAEEGRLLAGSSSQHGDKWQRRRFAKNPVRDLFEDEFNVPFYDGPAYAEMRVGDQTYWIAASHEFPGHSQWSPNHPQMRAAVRRFQRADVIVMGDKHTPALQQLPLFLDEYHAGNRPSPWVTLLQSGTTKTGPDPYTLSRWPRGYLGWPIIVLHPDHHQVDVRFSLNEIEAIVNAK